MQKEQYHPTGQQETILTNEQLRFKFPPLYDLELFLKTIPKEIIR